MAKTKIIRVREDEEVVHAFKNLDLLKSDQRLDFVIKSLFKKIKDIDKSPRFEGRRRANISSFFYEIGGDMYGARLKKIYKDLSGRKRRSFEGVYWGVFYFLKNLERIQGVSSEEHYDENLFGRTPPPITHQEVVTFLLNRGEYICTDVIDKTRHLRTHGRRREYFDRRSRKLGGAYRDLRERHRSRFIGAYIGIEEFCQTVLMLDIEWKHIDQATQMYQYQHGRLTAGDYMVHPDSDNLLVDLSKAHYEIAKGRHNELVDIFKDLGAKKIVLQEEESKKMAGGGTVEARALFVSAKGKIEIKKNKYSYAHVLAEYHKPEFNQVQAAEDRIRRSKWFSNDQTMTTILNGRRNGGNLAKYSYHVKHISDFGLNAELSARLWFVKISAEFSYSRIKEIDLFFEVEFWDNSTLADPRLVRYDNQ